MNEEKMEYMEDNVFGNTYSALEALLINCRTMQRQFRNSPVDMATDSFIRDLCTVRMATSRRCGHSISVIRLALEYFCSAVFICPTCSIRDNFRMSFKRYCEDESIVSKKQKLDLAILDNDSEYYFLSAGSLNSLRGRQTEAIIVDPFCGMEDNRIDEIYSIGDACLSRNPFKFFVFVG